MKKPLYLALALLPGLASAAQPQRALRTIHCQFENGVTIDGERALRLRSGRGVAGSVGTAGG